MTMQKILVVDDDKEVVRLMRGYLEQAGYDVKWPTTATLPSQCAPGKARSLAPGLDVARS